MALLFMVPPHMVPVEMDDGRMMPQGLVRTNQKLPGGYGEPIVADASRPRVTAR
jgi:hypothetical protein